MRNLFFLRRAMRVYSAMTRNRALPLIRARGWGVVLTPDNREPRGLPYFVDNGAWPAFVSKRPWDSAAFERLLELRGPGADFVVLPHRVGAGAESLELSLSWRERVLECTPRAALAVQDGLEPADVAGALGPRVSLFLGGTTAWKWRMLPLWGELARRARVPLHVARVNTSRGFRAASMAGAASVDGSSVARFPSTISRWDRALREPALKLLS